MEVREKGGRREGEGREKGEEAGGIGKTQGQEDGRRKELGWGGWERERVLNHVHEPVLFVDHLLGK